MSTVEAIDNVAAMAAMPVDQPVVALRGYTSAGDNGGGLLVHDASSLAAIDNGLTFPAIVGRYRRLYGTSLTTNDFGIKTDLSADMSVRFQNFIDACIWERCQAVISPSKTGGGGIDLNGATIYLNATGTRSGPPFHGVTIKGVNKRFSRLTNGVISVGQVFAQIGGAGTAHAAPTITDFMLTGRLDIWSAEGGGIIQDVRIIPNGVAGAYDAEHPECDFQYGLILSYCNHLNLRRVRLEGYSNRNGACITGAAQLQWSGGGAVGLDKGICIRPLGFAGEAGNARINLENLDCESMNQEFIVAENVDGLSISGCHLRHLASGTLGHAMIRVGRDASAGSLCNNVTIDNNYCVTASTGGDTCIDLQRAAEVKIETNRIGGYGVGVKASTDVAKVQHVAVDDSNTFPSTVTPYSAATAWRRPQRVKTMLQPVVLSSVSPTWAMNDRSIATCALGVTGATVAVSGFIPGEEYTLALTKKVAGASVAAWVATAGIFVWPDSMPPTFSDMTVTQIAIIRFHCFMNGTQAMLVASSDIVGS